MAFPSLAPNYYIWAFLSMALGVAWGLSWVSVPRLRLVRRHLHSVSAGETLVFEVEVENLSRRTAYDDYGVQPVAGYSSSVGLADAETDASAATPLAIAA